MPAIQTNNKLIAKNTLFLYLRTMLTMFVALFTSRVVLNALGIEDFGVWGVIGGLVSMFSFINSSLSSSVFRYLAYAIGVGDKAEVNKTYNASLIIHLALALVIFLLCESVGYWFLAEKMVVPEAKREITNLVFHLVVITSCISLLTVPFNSVIIAYERMNVYAYLAIIDAFIKLLIAYVVYIVPSYKLVWYAVMALAVAALMLVFYYIYVRMNFRHLYFQRVRDLHFFRLILNFSAWSMFGNVAYVGYSQGLNILLNIFFGPAVNAARAVSLQVEQTVRTFIINFQTAINPQIIKNYAARDYQQMHMLLCRSCKFSVFLLAFFALPIVLETNNILILWLKQVPEHTVNFCRIMFAVIALECMTNAVGTGVVATGDIKKYHIIVGSTLMTIVPISYFVLRLNSPAESVFFIYLCVEVIAVLFRLWIAREKIQLSIRLYFADVVLRVTVVLGLAAVVPYLIHVLMADSITRLLAVLVTSVITNALSIYYIGLTKNERTLIKSLIRSKLHL